MGSLPKASQGFQGSSGSFQAPSLSPGVVSAALCELPQASSGSSLRSPPQASPGCLKEKLPPPFASFPRSSPRSSRLRRNLSIAAENFAPARAPPCAALSKICADLWVGASPRLPPGSSCLAGLWGNRGRSPYRMCRSLSRVFMQIFHSFSSRAVGAVFVATSLRHLGSFPFLQE